MNEQDLRYLKQLIAEGKMDEAIMLINRRLESIREDRHYNQFKQIHGLQN